MKSEERRNICWLGLIRQRVCWVPTLRGWLVLAACGAAVGLTFLFTVHPFLAVTDGKPGGVLVIEGWASDPVFEAGLSEFHRHTYDRLYVTGGPIEHGAPLSEYKSYAERGAAILLKSGLSTNAVRAVPSPQVVQDRTYASAVSLRQWLEQHQVRSEAVHLFTEGAHARRSRLLFQKAFGSSLRVTVTATQTRGYDAKRWWRSSAGVRTVIGEVLAYAYARLFFRP